VKSSSQTRHLRTRRPTTMNTLPTWSVRGQPVSRCVFSSAVMSSPLEPSHCPELSTRKSRFLGHLFRRYQCGCSYVACVRSPQPRRAHSRKSGSSIPMWRIISEPHLGQAGHLSVGEPRSRSAAWRQIVDSGPTGFSRGQTSSSSSCPTWRSANPASRSASTAGISRAPASRFMGLSESTSSLCFLMSSRTVNSLPPLHCTAEWVALAGYRSVHYQRFSPDSPPTPAKFARPPVQ